MSGMNTQKKRHLIRSLSVILLMMCVFTLVTRLWPILFLMLLAIFCYALWMLIRIQKTPEPEQAAMPAEPETAPRLLTEQEMLSAAFGLLQRRITEQVVAAYPDARWIWSVSNAMERFASGEALEILLNGAGGYRKATVLVQNLQFCGLAFPTQAQQDPSDGNDAPVEGSEDAAEDGSEDCDAESVDYGLLAFEWVSANVTRLIAQSSEAIAGGNGDIHIPESELPHGDSWQEICNELMCNGFASAEPVADGIHAKIKITQ